MSNETEDVAKHAKWLQSDNSSFPSEASEEKPRKTSRVGDEYQAQIPDLMTENNRLQETTTSQYSKIDDHATETDSGTETSLVSVPDSISDDRSWSESQKDGFLLGLYLFGKNFHLVDKFVGYIGIRNILPYYYGRFYRTIEHQEWSTFRKRKHKKIIPGQKIFTGWRQRELFARLFSNLTNECKASLALASRMYVVERLPYETYVFTVRDKVGIDRFIEAVAIGKGKQDLTVAKAKKAPVEKELPPISSLKTQQIIDILKFGIGLSKERLSGLFWEAVWPRLLARGWHSELPLSRARQGGLTETLVFIVPGIKKFSKRGLVKGTQYYESYIDVLNKVASEPQLIELKSEPVDPDSDGGSDHEEVMQFTIVNSSNVHIGVEMWTEDDLPRSEWLDIKEDIPEEYLNGNSSNPKGKRLNKNLKRCKPNGDQHEAVKEPSRKKKRRTPARETAITNVQPGSPKPTDSDGNADQHTITTPDGEIQTTKRASSSGKPLESVPGSGSKILDKKRKDPKEKNPMDILAETVLQFATNENGDDSPK